MRSSTESRPLVSLQGISKRFGPVQALREASFSAWAGEIHVILGENGAGKTSLMLVLAGLYQPDAGEVRIGGRAVQLTTPADALRLGVAMVPQHVELVENLTVWENVLLGRGGVGWLNRRAGREAVRRLAAELGIDLDVGAGVRHLSAGQQQKVEILKALYRQAQILILDEPTTFLTPQETDALYETLRRLAERGLAVLLVTHKLRDALRIGDRLTVMRSGEAVATLPAATADPDQLVQWLIRSDARTSQRLLSPEPLHPLAADAPVLLSVQGLTTAARRGRVTLRQLDLTLRAGEIHGIAGIAGSGQRELAEALLGLLPAARGEIRLRGESVGRWSVARRLAAGISLIPEDRIHDAILPALPLYETLVLGQHREVFPGLRYSAQTARRMAAEVIRQYEVKAPGPDFPVGALSGGNIQKVVVARALQMAARHRPAVLVAVGPTTGLDLRTVRQVRDQLRGVAVAGGAVLLMSEDLDELMEECHSISVLHQGRLVAQFAREAFDRYRIGEAMLGRAGEASA